MLKLTATKLELEAKQAQGEDVADKLAAELKKLNNNISLDKAAAGQPSTALPFTATISGGGAKRRAVKARANNASNGGLQIIEDVVVVAEPVADDQADGGLQVIQDAVPIDDDNDEN